MSEQGGLAGILRNAAVVYAGKLDAVLKQLHLVNGQAVGPITNIVINR